MKRKSLTLAMVLMMTGAVLFTSCIGSFRLTRSVYDWNQTVGDKFVNELVFLMFSIVPVYEVAVFIDVIVLNSIEFWSGENPMDASNEVKAIDTENGRFLVRRTADGYELTNERQGTTTALRFDEAGQTWSVETPDGERIPFMSFIDANNVRIYLPDGTTQQVELSEAGLTAFQAAIQASAPAYAAR
jgi:YD repeat-containing protein